MLPKNKAVAIRSFNEQKRQTTTYIFGLDGTLINYYDFYCGFSNTGKYMSGNGKTWDLMLKSLLVPDYVSEFSSNDKIVYQTYGRSKNKNPLLSKDYTLMKYSNFTD